MIYLVISVAGLSALGLAMRYSVSRGATPLALNFVFRGVVALYLILPVLIAGTSGSLATAWEADLPLTLLAVVAFWLSGLASIKAVQLGPLGASWTVLRCSMVLPVVASVFYWHELSFSPVSARLVMRILGILMSLGMLILAGFSQPRTDSSGQPRSSTRGWMPWLLAAFLAQGVWEICLRATRGFSGEDARSLFLLAAFAGSSALTVPALAATKTAVRWKEVKFGLLLGVCALLGTGCRVLALKSVDGIIVFPVTAVVGILVAQSAGRLIWHEKSPRAILVGALGIAAVLLLTL